MCVVQYVEATHARATLTRMLEPLDTSTTGVAGGKEYDIIRNLHLGPELQPGSSMNRGFARGEHRYVHHKLGCRTTSPD